MTHPNALRMARLCAALVSATILHLGVFLFAWLVHDGPPDPLLTWGHLAWAIVFAGLALAWVGGGFPLLVWAWRASSHRVRFLLVGLLLSIPVLLQLGSWFPYALLLLFLTHSLISALLLVWVSYEVGALRQSASTPTRSSFTVVSGMALTLLGGFLLDLSCDMLSRHHATRRHRRHPYPLRVAWEQAGVSERRFPLGDRLAL